MSGSGQPLLLGRYKKLSQLGFGGVAAVFKVYDLQTKRVCALKILAKHIYDSPEGKERLRRESQVMLRLDHPGIVKLYRLHESPPAIAMELVSGRSLAGWQSRHGAMPGNLVLQVAKQVVEALGVLHEAGMVHRDIKPGNILIAPSGRCKLVDFGLARIADSVSVTQTGIFIGTHGFMAPEQVSDAKQVDHRADIFSVGQTLLSMLVGDPPSGQDPLLEKAADLVSDEFARLLMSMTLMKRDYRPQNCAEIIQRLQRLPSEPELPNGPKLHLNL